MEEQAIKGTKRNKEAEGSHQHTQTKVASKDGQRTIEQMTESEFQELSASAMKTLQGDQGTSAANLEKLAKSHENIIARLTC